MATKVVANMPGMHQALGPLRPDTPDLARRLATLADWVDVRFPDDAEPEMQNDLREWARRLRALLPEEAPA